MAMFDFPPGIYRADCGGCEVEFRDGPHGRHGLNMVAGDIARATVIPHVHIVGKTGGEFA